MGETMAKSRIRQTLQQAGLKLFLIQALCFLLLGAGIASWWHGGDAGRSPGRPAGNEAASPSSEAEIWNCSMHPQIRRDGPGKCPICGMDLVPVKKSAGGVRTISISSDVMKLMNVQTVPVERRYVTANVRMVGKIEYDQTRLAHITAWVSGRLDRLFVDYEGVEVKKGDHMAYIYSEELFTAQEELISAIESKAERPTSRFVEPIDLAESAREKLRLLGITEEQIQEIEQRGTPSTHLTIYSPAGGVVVKKLKQEGDRVATGDRIYTVADLSHLWVQLDAYESDLQWLRYGQDVEFTTEAYPGEFFHGRIAFIDPVLNEATRTVKVRVNVANEDGRLKPEMFVRAVVRSQIASGGRVLDASLAGKWISPMHPEIVKDEPGTCDICGMPLVRAESLGFVTAEPTDAAKPLVVPVSAALLTGTRAIVYVQIPNAPEPTYEGREVVLGPRAGDDYLVKSGVQEGELVVVNGNFKLDSALQIAAKPSMMTPEGGGSGGHHHGGESATKADGQPLPQSQHSGMSIPEPLQTQLHETVGKVADIGEAIESAELKAIRKSFDALGEQVASLGASQLTGDMRSQLDELTMLLRNDAVEGRDIHSMQTADRLYLLTKQHAERLQKALGLAHGAYQMAREILDVPVAFREQLGRIVPFYLAIGNALAADNPQPVTQSIGGLQQAANSVDGGLLADAAANRWGMEVDSLAKIIEQLSGAKDLAEQRSAFALLSDEILSLHHTFGFTSSDPLYQLHCPMAFEGRGATWLQADEQVRNPYYGASMLRCADQVESLETRVESQN